MRITTKNAGGLERVWAEVSQGLKQEFEFVLV